MSFQTSFLQGVAELLAAEGVGVWSPTAPYSPGDVAIVFDELSDKPDRGIALGMYPVSDSGNTDSVVAVQLYIRGTPGSRTDTKHTADAAFNVLHDKQGGTIGDTPLVRCWRNSGAPLGRDQNGRQESTDNYYFQISRSGTHRTD